MSKITFIFAALSMMIAAPVAMANHHGKPHGQYKHCAHKHDSSVFITTKDKQVLREYLAQDAKDRCAKNGDCKPYAAGKKRYMVGSKLATGAYRPLPDYVVHDLQPVPNGYRYVMVNHDVLLIHGPSKHVVDSYVAGIPQD